MDGRGNGIAFARSGCAGVHTSSSGSMDVRSSVINGGECTRTMFSSLSALIAIQKNPALECGVFQAKQVAGWTGLEPATSGVTGRRSNQLSYTPPQHRNAVVVTYASA